VGKMKERFFLIFFFFFSLAVLFFVYFALSNQKMGLERYDEFCSAHNGTLKANGDCWIKVDNLTFQRYELYEDENGSIYFVK
jgi:hypothetical protein